MPSEAQQVKFRLSVEEAAVVEAALPEGTSMASFAKLATLAAASPTTTVADAQSRSVEARQVQAAVEPSERIAQERSQLEARIEHHKAQARPWARVAMVCDHVECVPPHRRFFDSEEEAARWCCPDHGRAVQQENRPYFGVSTEKVSE